MSLTKEIIIPRGNNIGQTIKDTLESINLYSHIDIIGFNFNRKPEERKTIVTINYIHIPLKN